MALKEQIGLLIKLQKTDVEIKALQEIIAKAPQQIEDLEHKRQHLKEDIRSAQAQVDDLQKQYRAWEADMQDNQSKIEHEQQKLREVKNNKEYQAVLKGIEDLEAVGSDLEDQMIQCLDEIDAAETRVQEQEAVFARLVAEIDIEERQLRHEAEKSQNALDALEAARAAAVTEIAPEYMQRFDRVKKIVGSNVAVAPVKNAVCRGCHLNIPPQMFNELQRHEDLMQCPQCQRIIYWQDAYELAANQD